MKVKISGSIVHTNQPLLHCEGRLCREELDSVTVCGGQVQHLPLDDFTGVYSSQSPTHQGGEEISIHLLRERGEVTLGQVFV